MRPQSYWEKAWGVQAHALTPPPAAGRADVAIVGAGFCGSWLAYFLKRAHPDLQIAILERDFLSFGASTRNAGFLSCGNVSEWLEDSRQMSWDELAATLYARIEGVRILRREFSHLLSPIRCGSADLDAVTDEKRDLLDKLNHQAREWGIENLFALRQIPFAGGTRVVPFNSFDGEVDPVAVLSGLHERLRAQGVRFLWNCDVTAIGKGLVEYVSGEQSRELSYGYGFVCTNAFARALNPNTFVRPARGQILVTAPCETSTQPCLGFYRAGYDYFRFIGKRLLVGGGRLEFKLQEDTDRIETTEEVRGYLLDLAQSVLGHGQFQIEDHWSGIMGLRDGKHAAIGDFETPVMLDSQTEEIAGFGGWGVTLTPYVTARKVTALRFKRN